MEKRVLMILADGFEETEAIAVADVIRRLGMKLDAAGFEMSVRGAHGFILQSDLLLADISVALADMRVSILQVNVVRRNDDDTIINLKVGCKNIEHYHSIVSRLRGLNGVNDILRGFA